MNKDNLEQLIHDYMEKYDDYVSKAHRDKVMRELLQKDNYEEE